jgi:hypothetical protein
LLSRAVEDEKMPNRIVRELLEEFRTAAHAVLADVLKG